MKREKGCSMAQWFNLLKQSSRSAFEFLPMINFTSCFMFDPIEIKMLHEKTIKILNKPSTRKLYRDSNAALKICSFIEFSVERDPLANFFFTSELTANESNV